MYSSANWLNFSNTAISSLALLVGWKNPIGAALDPIGSLVVCVIFHGKICVMSSPAGSRSTLTHTWGPEAMPRLLDSARAAALHMSWQSDMVSYSDRFQKAPGWRLKLSEKYGLRANGSELMAALMTQFPISQASTA